MTCVDTIMTQMPDIFKPQRRFMCCLIAALQAFSGRATMANLSRYGAGSERTLARWSRQTFDFTGFNLSLLDSQEILSHRLAAAFDPSFIPKSGKHTWGLSKFYNSCASRAEKGLEVCTLALLDRDEETAYAVAVEQTPAELPDEQTRMDFYLSVLQRNAQPLREYTHHLVVDGGLARDTFIDGAIACGFDLIGKLRRDANLRYLYDGPYSGFGRPKTYDGKVLYDDLSKMDEIASNVAGVRNYTAIVNHKHFKRTIRVVVIVCERKGKRRHMVLFSTDTSLSGEEIIELYSLRFQIEFLFRDGKQYTGFGQAQVRDEKGQGFFFNASLSTLNVMRLNDRSVSGTSDGRIVSIMSWKRRKYNEMIVERLCEECGLRQWSGQFLMRI